MEAGQLRLEFASDNTAGICPEVLQAIQDANHGHVSSYGDDAFTDALCRRVREIFETDCEVFLVFNGTAANALILAQICRSYHGIFCHRNAHIQTDECGAPEFFTGGAKLITLNGENGKVSLEEFSDTLDRFRDLHSHKPRVVSLAQATEAGTVYTSVEIEALADFAHRRDMLVHMDGARFANALATLGVTPKQATWQAGVDAMSFGGIKNGGATAELVVFFRKELAFEFEYRAKQAGQLASKMRFLSAPWLALLKDELWLRNAGHANASARKLAETLGQRLRIPAAFPVEANVVFVSLDRSTYDRAIQAGWRFYNFFQPGLYRLMCSWATTPQSISALVEELAGARSA